MAERKEFWQFRVRDPSTGKWYQTRYRAEVHEIKERYAEYELIGTSEVRIVEKWTGFRTPDPPWLKQPEREPGCDDE